MFSEASSWSPVLFSGIGSVALRAGRSGRAVGESADIIEGWRASASPTAVDFDPRAAVTPIYRPVNVQQFRLHPDPEHWASPHIQGRWCVRPGDVVLNKAAPVRAAYVSPAAYRHPVDGNSIILRGLPRPHAVWVMVCLNHPGYERLLVMSAGTLDRVGLKALADLRVPPPPPAMEGISARLSDALDDATMLGEALHHLRAEAEQVTSEGRTTSPSPRPGTFFTPPSLDNDNWLPKATTLRARQAVLAAEHGWIALGDLASWQPRDRLTTVPEGAHALRLRDVGEDLFVAPPTVTIDNLDLARTLATPLVPGDVLLSTFGTSFRAATVDDDVPRPTFLSDGWVRIRVRETPAAFALLLSTTAIRTQAAELTIGSVHQFVPPEALRSLRVPVPPREVRERWQRAVERHHAQRRRHDALWAALVHEMNTVFETTHRPFAKARPDSKEANP